MKTRNEQRNYTVQCITVPSQLIFFYGTGYYFHCCDVSVIGEEVASAEKTQIYSKKK